MFHWEDMSCKQTAYENQLKFSMKTQNFNFFTFAVRFTHNPVQGSSALKHVHCPVHPSSGLLPHLINSHNLLLLQGDLFTTALIYHWLAFTPIIQEIVIIAG